MPASRRPFAFPECADNVDARGKHAPRGLWLWDARIKLVVTLVLILSVSFIPARRGSEEASLSWLPDLAMSNVSMLVLAGAGLLILSGFWWSRVAPAEIGRRCLWLLPLWLLLLISVPLAQGSGDLGQFMTILLRSLVCLAALVLLAVTTPFDSLLVAMRQLRLPRLFVSVLGFLYRYLFVFVDELGRMRRARRARTFGRRRAGNWRNATALVGMLQLRAFERSERVHAAMRARSFGSGDASATKTSSAAAVKQANVS